MRFILGIIKFVVVFVVLGVVALFVTVILAFSGLVMLLIGRRPQFRVYTSRDFREPFEYDRPPMKDVTPRMVNSPGGN